MLGSSKNAFQARLASFGATSDISDASLSPPPVMQFSSSPEQRPEPFAKPNLNGIDKSRLAHPHPRRVRDRDHLRFVAKQPCLICGRRPSDPHHLRFAQRRALGRKVSDEFTVPLCRGHHRELHRCGDEAAWWAKIGIDPAIPARGLWLESHPLPTASDKTDLEGTTDLPAANSGDSKRDRRTGKGGPKYKTKPIIAAGAQ